MKYADLHIHTYFSDGTFSPEEVVKNAISGNLSAVSITDHDSVEAIDLVKALAKDKIEVIPGVELTAEMGKSEVHILGYFINWKDDEFKKELNLLGKVRQERARKILAKLKELKMEIKYEDLIKFSGPGTVGRLHIARMMCSLGYVANIKEAFLKYLSEGKLAYVGKFRLSTKKAIEVIKKVGGISVLAHPYNLGHDEWFPNLIKEGLDGLEVYYNKQDPQITVHYERLAHKFGLLMTGGSDCHGRARGKSLLGKVKFPYTLVEQLKIKKQG